MKKQDLTGMQFGNLEVIDEAPQYVSPKGHHKSMWNCRCACGNKCVVMGSHLISGHSSSCGCQKIAKLQPRRAGDLTGKEFGMLTVIRRMPNRQVGNNSRVVWRCRCECGNETDVLALLLKEGLVKSCGCRSVSHAERIMAGYLDSHHIEFVGQYSPDGLHGVNGGSLKFDFAVFAGPELIMLIELDGEQHYRPVEYFGGAPKYETVKANDALKSKWAAEHGIQLVRIDVSKCYKDSDFVSAYDRDLVQYHTFLS